MSREALLSALETQIEAADVNIGQVHTEEPEFASHDDLKTEGTVSLEAGSEIDSDALAGRTAIRVWWMQARTAGEQATNRSVDRIHEVTLTAFYAASEELSQEAALRKAVSVLLDHLDGQDVELTELSTGDGWLGYLGVRPRQITPVSRASLGGRIHGYATQILVTAHEEASV